MKTHGPILASAVLGLVVLSGCAAFPPPKQFPIDNSTGTHPKPDDAERER